jgi:hypothetical protein
VKHSKVEIKETFEGKKEKKKGNLLLEPREKNGKTLIITPKESMLRSRHP